MKEVDKTPNLSGFVLVDKPVDWTSHDVVGFVRNIVKNFYKKMGLPAEVSRRETKVGHAGTLDPFATGLLIVGIGREATKKLDEFKALPKEYEAVIRLGATSDTQDRTGKITMKQFNNITMELSEKKVKETLNTFLGHQTQTPPMYSAKKVGGKKLYNLARQGIEIERKANEIEIYKLDLLEYDPSSLVLRVSCLVSAGTYIRTLAHDIGQALGCGAYCEELRRTKIGVYRVEDAIIPKDITAENLINNIFNL